VEGARKVSRHKTLLILFGTIAISAVLQVLTATRSTLWADELFSIAMATGHSLEHPASSADPALGDFLEGTAPRSREEFTRYMDPDDGSTSPGRVIRATLMSDTSPPLYYVLLGQWIRIFGSSDFAVRFFSILCTLLCIPFVADIARRTTGSRTVIFATILFSLSPITTFYGTEARMYSLIWLLLVITAWAGLRVRVERRRWIWWSAWIFASTAGLLTHYFFIFPWSAVAAYLFIWPGRIRRREFFVACATMGILLLPWYLRLPESLNNWRVTQDWLKWAPSEYSHFRTLIKLATQFFSGSMRGVWSTSRKAELLLIFVTFLLMLAVIWRMRSSLLVPRRLLPILWFSAAIIGPFAFDFLLSTYSANVPRYALSALPAACLLIAFGLGCLPHRISWCVLILFSLIWTLSYRSILENPDRAIFRISHVINTFGDEPTKDDVIFVHSIPSGVLAVARYYKGSAPIYPWVSQLGERSIPESIQSAIQGRNKVYFVRIHEVGAPAHELSWFYENATVEFETDWGYGKISVFKL
jgi:mannosyltransferase